MEADYRAPIIGIGAGRSGSTLLAAIFNSHPKISFFSETHFLVPVLWERVFKQHDLIMNCLVNWRNEENLPQQKAVRRETERLNRLIAEFAFRVMKADPNRPFWGYKEIWNGSRGFVSMDWSIYDQVFPRAKWVHLVRNPITYAPSGAGFVGQQTFSRQQFENQLADWVRIHVYNASRRSSGRYTLIRYEDILAESGDPLRRLLETLGIDWDQACVKAMERQYVPTKSKPIIEQGTFSRPFRIDGLYALVNELGYEREIAAMGVKIEEDGVNPYELHRAA